MSQENTKMAPKSTTLLRYVLKLLHTEYIPMCYRDTKMMLTMDRSPCSVCCKSSPLITQLLLASWNVTFYSNKVFSFKKDQFLVLYRWQTSLRDKRWIFVDKKGEISWTLLVNFCGHFLGDFDEFPWTLFW